MAVGGLLLLMGGCTSATKSAPEVVRDAGSERGPQEEEVGSADARGESGPDADAADLSAATCLQAPPRGQTAGTPLAVGLTVTLGGSPLTFGEPNPYHGGSLTPLNVRFYLSHLSVVRSDGQVLPLDLVGSSGDVEPFGVHFVNVEEPSTLTFHTVVPDGQYREIRFVWGVDDVCNGGSSTRTYPLDDTSQMTWPHFQGLGYLFFRYEARWAWSSSPDGGDAVATGLPPTAIHMGGVVGSVFAPEIHVLAALNVMGTAPLTKTMQISLDAIFDEATSLATTPSPLSTSLGPEVALGDRLRQRAPAASIFKLEP